ncbi:MAG: formate/nitrite transporter family protein [Synergistaceae bacterium]|nr:formate/nitrite transporter family protein [Synergistaceae bacterium]
MLTPSQIKDKAITIGENKANLSCINQFLLGILAGAFIAFGSQASSMATHTIEAANTAKFIGGLIFPAGLIMVLVAGAELFTGNCLMIISFAEKRITLAKLLRSWLIVYLGNLAGSVLIALLINWSGQLNINSGLLGAFTIKTAAGKISLSFCNALVLGILCNWLVCLAVWMSFGTDDFTGKVLAAFFPVWVFIASGFEHSIANMYYISAGLFAKCNASYVSKALEAGLSETALNNLTWPSMFVNNLLPVTLGNILGGALFVGLVYWFVYRSKN